MSKVICNGKDKCLSKDCAHKTEHEANDEEASGGMCNVHKVQCQTCYHDVICIPTDQPLTDPT